MDEELKEKLYDLYMANLGEEFNFYANQADQDGLLAVYNAGLEAGRQENKA